MTNAKPNIIVTGSSGLIGSAVVRRLAPTFQVIGFDLEGEPYPPPQAECVSVDLTSEASIERGLDRIRYAYGDAIASVVHLAAYYNFSGGPSPLYEQVTVRGTERLLHALQQFDVQQFIFSSTMLVHRPTEPGHPLNEDWPLEAKWDYPQSKIDTERAIHEARGAIPALNLRVAGVYTDYCDSIPISNQIQRIYERRLTSHVYPGDVNRGQTFVHLEDLVDAIVLAIDARTTLPDEMAILIGEPVTYSYDELQRAFAAEIHHDPDWETHEIPKSIAKTGAWIEDKVPGMEDPFIKPWMIDMADDHYELDIARANDLLGWHPRHTLLDTIPLMIRAIDDDPETWFKHHNLEVPSDIVQNASR